MPETPGPEADTHPAFGHVSPLRIKTVAEFLKTPPLVMDDSQHAPLQGVSNLPLSTGYTPHHAIRLKGLTLADRRYLALKGHPESVEHAGRDAVSQRILTLQRGEGNTSAVTAKKLALEAAVKFAVGR